MSAVTEPPRPGVRVYPAGSAPDNTRTICRACARSACHPGATGSAGGACAWLVVVDAVATGGRATDAPPAIVGATNATAAVAATTTPVPVPAAHARRRADR